MNVQCPSCETVYRVDPVKVPEGGIRARCTVCATTIAIRRDATAATAVTPAARPAPLRQAPGEPAPIRPAPVPPKAAAAPQPPAAKPTPPQPPAAPAPVRPQPPKPSQEAPPARRVTQPFFQQRGTGGVHPAPPAEPAAAPPAAAPPPRPSAPVFRPTPGQPVTAAPDPAPPPARQTPPRSPQGPAPASRPVPAPPVPPAAAAASTTEEKKHVNPFLARDPRQKARRLARALVSDMIVYQPEKRQQALAKGNLKDAFEDEILKSWHEYVEQVGEELATSTSYWNDALNEILAGGQSVF